RYVAFSSMVKEHAQVLVRDTCVGVSGECQAQTRMISIAMDGGPANDDSRSPSMSADGRFVAFSSAATNLTDVVLPGRQVYVRDTCLGADAACQPKTLLISTDSNGALTGSESILPSVSSTGRFVAFLAVRTSQDAHASVGKSS